MFLHLVAQRVAGQWARHGLLWATWSCEVYLLGGNVLGFFGSMLALAGPRAPAHCVFDSIVSFSLGTSWHLLFLTLSSVYLRFTLYALDSRGSRSEASYVTVRTSCPIVDDSRAEGTPPLSLSISLPSLHLNPSEKIVSSHLLLAWMKSKFEIGHHTARWQVKVPRCESFISFRVTSSKSRYWNQTPGLELLYAREKKGVICG